MIHLTIYVCILNFVCIFDVSNLFCNSLSVGVCTVTDLIIYLYLNAPFCKGNGFSLYYQGMVYALPLHIGQSLTLNSAGTGCR